MIRMKKTPIIVLALGIVLSINSCRKHYEATEQDMADYGWLLFEKAVSKSDYTDSKEWFLKSVNEDTTYMDGYNGLGWSFGKLTDIDSSIYFFETGLRFSPSIYDTTNIRFELLAGLCFANNAEGLDVAAIAWGDRLIDGLSSGLATNKWVFTHNNLNNKNKINHLDLRVTMAASNFAIGEFSKSVNHIQSILTELSGSTTFNPDVNLVSGRAELAVWIDSLSTILSNQ